MRRCTDMPIHIELWIEVYMLFSRCRCADTLTRQLSENCSLGYVADLGPMSSQTWVLDMAVRVGAGGRGLCWSLLLKICAVLVAYLLGIFYILSYWSLLLKSYMEDSYQNLLLKSCIEDFVLLMVCRSAVPSYGRLPPIEVSCWRLGPGRCAEAAIIWPRVCVGSMQCQGFISFRLKSPMEDFCFIYVLHIIFYIYEYIHMVIF